MILKVTVGFVHDGQLHYVGQNSPWQGMEFDQASYYIH